MIRLALILVAAGLAFGQTSEVAAAREAVREAEAAHGAQHPVTAMMVRNLALAFAEAGYNRQAEYYARQAMETLEARFGAGDVSLVPSLNVLTEAYAAEGRLSEAIRTATRAVAIGPDAGAHYEVAVRNLAAVRVLQSGRVSTRGRTAVRTLK